tara:strand:+ start:16538 stop:17434 length:897 start_codon:yes stop_codon:yes gene_type:complete
MDLNTLRAFVVLAEEEHMTRAAERLHLTQPAISNKLKRLEAELSHPLFHRTPKGLTLTEAGEIFLVYAQEAIHTVEKGEEALQALGGLLRGKLSVGAGATATHYLLPALVGGFHADYPGVQMFIKEQGSQTTLEDVLEGKLDLGIVTLPRDGHVERRFHQQLLIRDWVKDELVLYLPRNHVLMTQQTFRWEDLQDERMVLFEAGSAVRDMIDTQLKKTNTTPHVVMELRSIEASKKMVEQGIGGAFLSRYAMDEEHVLHCEDASLTRQLAIIHKKNRIMSPAVKTFLGYMLASKGPEE